MSNVILWSSLAAPKLRKGNSINTDLEKTTHLAITCARKVETAFVNTFGLDDMCGPASIILVELLRTIGISSQAVWNGGHMWVELGNLYLDPTYAQFGEDSGEKISGLIDPLDNQAIARYRWNESDIVSELYCHIRSMSMDKDFSKLRSLLAEIFGAENTDSYLTRINAAGSETLYKQWLKQGEQDRIKFKLH